MAITKFNTNDVEIRKKLIQINGKIVKEISRSGSWTTYETDEGGLFKVRNGQCRTVSEETLKKYNPDHGEIEKTREADKPMESKVDYRTLQMSYTIGYNECENGDRKTTRLVNGWVREQLDAYNIGWGDAANGRPRNPEQYTEITITKVEPPRETRVKGDGKPRICGNEFNFDKYVIHEAKTASGRPYVDIDDEVANLLRGETLEEIYTMTAEKLKVSRDSLIAKYEHLNVGMQRMNLGNRLRKAMKDKQMELPHVN
jgi:hypothetical protein